MFGNIAIFCILGTFVEGLSSVRQSDSNNSSMRPTLSPENEKCQSLCGSNNMSDCGRFGSYCKPFGPPEDGVGVCQGFYYLTDNTTCFFNTHPDPAVCPQDTPVPCGGNTTTTPSPTSTPEPGPKTTTEPGPTTTTEPGPTTTAEPGPTTTTAEPGPTTTTEPGPTTTAEPGPTTTTEPEPTTTTEPGPTTTTESGPTTTTEPGPTTTAAPSPGSGHPNGTFVGNTSLGPITVTVMALFAETETETSRS